MSKFKETIFSKFFQSFYKDFDTYKNEDGKGILERFIEICSEYLDEQVSPDIENMLDLIDADKTPDTYIHLLWEYFGYIPYAYGLLNSGPNYNQSDLSNWVSSKYPTVDYRALLKYAISLYKIRCTSKFYEILGKFYNINIIITVPTSHYTGRDVNYDDPKVIYDSDYTYDQTLGCLECSKIYATVEIPAGTYAWLQENGQIDSAKSAIVALINKYLPVHVELITNQSVTIVEGKLVLLV